jgi:hypothetical protein
LLVKRLVSVLIIMERGISFMIEHYYCLDCNSFFYLILKKNKPFRRRCWYCDSEDIVFYTPVQEQGLKYSKYRYSFGNTSDSV